MEGALERDDFDTKIELKKKTVKAINMIGKIFFFSAIFFFPKIL